MNYPICDICDKADPGMFPPWEAVLYICALCPRRQEFLKQTEENGKTDRHSLTMVGREMLPFP
jgi:hypothetical protein